MGDTCLGTSQQLGNKKNMIACWDFHCETNTQWVRAVIKSPLRKWNASQVKDLTDRSHHISSEGPGKPPKHNTSEATEDLPLGKGTLGGWVRGLWVSLLCQAGNPPTQMPLSLMFLHILIICLSFHVHLNNAKVVTFPTSPIVFATTIV